MKKLTFAALCEKFIEHNKTDKEPITGYIVFRADNWATEYPLDSRTYAVSSTNKRFQTDAISNSIFGNSVDGSDCGVRLDLYMYGNNGKDGWKVDYCYVQ